METISERRLRLAVLARQGLLERSRLGSGRALAHGRPAVAVRTVGVHRALVADRGVPARRPHGRARVPRRGAGHDGPRNAARRRGRGLLADQPRRSRDPSGVVPGFEALACATTFSWPRRPGSASNSPRTAACCRTAGSSPRSARSSRRTSDSGSTWSGAPSGTWGRRQANLYAAATDWVGPEPEMSPGDTRDHLVRHYLTGFGPASYSEVAAFCSMNVGGVRTGDGSGRHAFVRRRGRHAAVRHRRVAAAGRRRSAAAVSWEPGRRCCWRTRGAPRSSRRSIAGGSSERRCRSRCRRSSSTARWRAPGSTPTGRSSRRVATVSRERWRRGARDRGRATWPSCIADRKT